MAEKRASSVLIVVGGLLALGADLEGHIAYPCGIFIFCYSQYINNAALLDVSSKGEIQVDKW